jgi:transporter family protein
MEVKFTRAAWLPPALVFVVASGLLGVMTKLALRELSWQEVLIWTAVVYAVISLGLLAAGRDRLTANIGDWWGALSGGFAAGALVLLFVALEDGEVSQVVPVTASYPVVTLVLSALVLRERVSRARVGATFLVIAGVILLSVD